MKTVILKEFIFKTKDPHIATHGITRGLSLQYYGGDTGLLIHHTPNYGRHISCERVRVDTKTDNLFSLSESPLIKFV